MSPEFLKKRFERVPKNPIELVRLGLRMWDRHDRLTQISYVNKQLTRKYSGFEGEHPAEGQFRVNIRPTKHGDGTARNITYFKEIGGKAYTRQVAMWNYDGEDGPGAAEKLAVRDTPQDGEGEETTVVFEAKDGLAAETDLPFSEVSQELSGLLKDFKRLGTETIQPPPAPPISTLDP